MVRKVNMLACAALIVLLSAGCQPAVERPSAKSMTDARALVWPQPPHAERIRYDRAIARPEDLGIRTSGWDRLWGTIFGREEEWFVRPTGIAASDREIFVADAGAQALWILDPVAGKFRKLRQAKEQQLVSPVALTLGREGRIYLTDSYLARIFVFDVTGKLLRTIEEARLRRPTGIAYDDRRDRLYVCDSQAHRVWIFDGAGTPLGSIGERGHGAGQFNFPTHLTLDATGNLFVVDALNFRVQMFRPDGVYAGGFGVQGDSSGHFASPKGVAVDGQGHVYVVDALFDAVQVFDRTGRYLLTFGERGIGAGQFWLPGGIAIDSRDRIYVADSFNQRLQIFQYVAGKRQ